MVLPNRTAAGHGTNPNPMKVVIFLLFVVGFLTAGRKIRSDKDKPD